MSLTEAATLTWLLLVAVSDLRKRRIPNVLSIGAVAVASLVLVIHGDSVLGGSIVSALWAAGIALALTLPAYIGHALGAGDVKLALAMGLLSDTATLGLGFIIGAMLSGLWTVLWLLTRRSAPFMPRPDGTEHGPVSAMPVVSRRPVPFGAAMCAGFALSMWLHALSQGV